MLPEEAVVGTRVRSLVAFSCVVAGTEGVIDALQDLVFDLRRKLAVGDVPDARANLDVRVPGADRRDELGGR